MTCVGNPAASYNEQVAAYSAAMVALVAPATDQQVANIVEAALVNYMGDVVATGDIAQAHMNFGATLMQYGIGPQGLEGVQIGLSQDLVNAIYNLVRGSHLFAAMNERQRLEQEQEEVANAVAAVALDDNGAGQADGGPGLHNNVFAG